MVISTEIALTQKGQESVLLKKVKMIEEELNELFVERESVIHGSLLGILSAKHVLLLGPPGTGKSLLARRICKSIVGTAFFERMLTRFTGQEEIFGPTSAVGLQEDIYRRVTKGYISEAHIVFLDEIYKANSAILNSLLMLLNERKFINDGVANSTPLISLFGASNEIPEDGDGLEAFDDRLQIRFLVNPISTPSGLRQMLSVDFPSDPINTITLQELQMAREQIANVNFTSDSFGTYVNLCLSLKESGLCHVTDRAFNQAMDILKAQAWLSGRNEIKEEDMEVLKDVFWKDPQDRKKMHLEILNSTNPEKSRITDIFQEAQTLVKELFKTAKDARTKVDQSNKGLEIIHKLKEQRVEIEKIILNMQKMNKDTSDAYKMYTTLGADIGKIARELVGINLETGKS